MLNCFETSIVKYSINITKFCLDVSIFLQEVHTIGNEEDIRLKSTLDVCLDIWKYYKKNINVNNSKSFRL